MADRGLRTVDDMEEHSPPERRLWHAVLIHAIFDLGVNTKVDDLYQRMRNRAIVRDAKEWFEGNGRGLEWVCEMAGVDADWLRAQYRSGRLTKLASDPDIRRWIGGHYGNDRSRQ